MKDDDLELVGPVRYRVRMRLANGRTTLLETMQHLPPTHHPTSKLGSPLVTFRSQKDGSFVIASPEDVLEVVMERCDRKYAEWRKIGTWPLPWKEGLGK